MQKKEVNGNILTVKLYELNYTREEYINLTSPKDLKKLDLLITNHSHRLKTKDKIRYQEILKKHRQLINKKTPQLSRFSHH
ncbi:hypothetical protein DID75_00970 [Candidatus Marinamargulisbacteria bacterium SCGC AG-410-N11]|nr:hypothetical protein DID75_00970 [Candidatus Marinamargulisbacteria bacterium SCGC AG-410-N11]